MSAVTPFTRIEERAMDQARIELLQRMPIFGGIRTDILQFVLGYCPVVTAARHELFFHEQDEGDSLFVLEQGVAAVLKSWHGHDHLIQILNAGDCFGEMAVIDHCRRSATVRAEEPSTAIRISAADLYRVYGQDLKQFTLIQMNMGREVCRRLRDANNRLFDAQMGTVDTDISPVFLA
jgi:CRP/FNR family cyclic AMP-dependent transcriptional regulator